MASNVTKVFSDFFTKTMKVSATVFQENVSLPADSTEGRIITLNEVSMHDSMKDCWIVIYDRVYDVTKFIDQHPGGGDLLLEYAGRDATGAFRASNHSNEAVATLDRFFIGQLPLSERIFRKLGGYRLTDIPA